ncbi:MAG: hypothetical protein O3A87_11260 [Verrucomicrobia bacterium]|nr:hypothetical protein [Verrucomicrobiota bacterium]
MQRRERLLGGRQGWGTRRDAAVTACGGTPTATGEAERVLGETAGMGNAAGRRGNGLRRDADSHGGGG